MTISKWLEQLATSNTSTDDDSQMMQNLLRRRVGLPKARVVLGVVYPEGYGPPISIQGMARLLRKHNPDDSSLGDAY